VEFDGNASPPLYEPDSGETGDDSSSDAEGDDETSVAEASPVEKDARSAEAEARPPCIGTVWPVAQGGNAHCYRAVSVPALITWDAANAAAIAAGGHLATISSAGENTFVFELTVTLPGAWAMDSVGGNQGPWLGGRKMGFAWTWVTGEPWVYTDWAAGEPSGTYNGTAEDRLQMRGEDGSLQPRQTWNDEDNGGFEELPRSYVIEFEP
jgi:hypothetical protein